MNKLLQRALVALASGALVFSGATTAAAQPVVTAPASVSVVAAKKATLAVTIKKIGNKTVSGSAKATIKPSYSKVKNVKVKSATLTVKKGSKTVAKNKTSAKLATGTYKVTTTVKYQYKGKTSTKTKTETIKVSKKAAKKTPVSKKPSGYNCPAGYPVKGNRTGSNKEWKYHVKGGQFYDRTKPEECFKNTSDARKAGYRASKR
ncbi:hypothetical protein [Glutamicibacter sp. NPDC087344]|uniref:sunset domain-containing protein n=1 Tax=Glutamicibacter sp. NPDC087344 TaxID=3363994 RepID=UPI0037FD38A2